MARRVTPTSGGTKRTRRRWPWILFVLLLVVPSLEIAVIIGVGRVVGAWPTVFLLVAESAFGAWLVKREGAQAWGALMEAFNTGRMPSRQLADAALVLVGGTLLLTPGFVTDLVGFGFVLPATRPIARRLLEVAVSRRLLAGAVTVPGGGRHGSGGAADDGRTTGGEIIEGEIIE